MRQTVVGVYDGYADACAAQRALTEAGLSQADISIYVTSVSASSTGGPRVYAPGGIDVRRERPVFDQLEQLFSRLFKPGEYPPETEDYREVIRRGGAIVSVDVSEVQTDLACDVMRRTGAADIEERAKAWHQRSGEQSTPAQHSDRATSREEPPPVSRAQESFAQQQQQPTTMREEPRGLGNDAPLRNEASMSAGDTSAIGEARMYRATPSSSPDPDSSSRMQQVSTRTEDRMPPPSNEPGQRTFTSGVPGDASDMVEKDSPSAGALRGSAAGPSSEADQRRDDAADAPRPEQASSAGYAGDPGMDTPFIDESPYDEEFRRDYDSRYANADAPYDDYRRAYTHGVSVAQDERHRGRDWSEVEPSAREHWEARYPDSAWERFKAAVRHGWERVTDRR
jgi:hypothetical protein